MIIDFSVPGLRTKDTPKFYKFWELVEKEAKSKNCFFFPNAETDMKMKLKIWKCLICSAG